MPYRRAHWWILALFPLAALAFWPNYVSVLASSPPSFHFHGISASLWLLLLAAQSWSIHHDKRAFHRANGLLSLALFPIFLAGGATIFVGMGQRAAAGSPFHAIWAPHLAWLDFVSVAGMAWFYFQALKHRRNVGKHASYLMATTIFLLPPIFGRMGPLFLGLDFSQADFFQRMGPGFHLGNLITIVIALLIAASDRKRAQPFLIAAGLTVMASGLFEFPGGTPEWKAIYAQLAMIPSLPLALAAAMAGGVIGWGGWVAGARPAARSALAA